MPELSWVTQSQVPELGVVKTASVTLTDAQIKATTAVTVIPATEILNNSGFPSSLPIIVSATAILDARGGDYEDVTDGSLFLAYSSDATGVTIATSQSLFGAAVKKGELFALLTNHFLEQDNFADNGLGIYILNDTILSGGDAANTLKVTVYYTVADVS